MLNNLTRLSISVQLLGPHDVVYLRQLLSDPPQAGVLGDDRLRQGLQAVGGGGGQELKKYFFKLRKVMRGSF